MIYSGRTTYQCHETVTFLPVYLTLYLCGSGSAVSVCVSVRVFYLTGLERGAHLLRTHLRQTISHLYKLSYYCGKIFRVKRLCLV